MNRLKIICVLFIIISSSHYLYAEPVKDLTWFKNLHPAIQFYLFERNQYRIIKEDDIRFLLPLNEIDLRLFSDVHDLDFLNDFKSIQKLYLPPSVNDFNALAEIELNELTHIDLSFTNISEQDITKLKAKKLKSINLSGTTIESFNFLKNYPLLSELIVLPNQVSNSQIIEIQRECPSLEVVFFEIAPLKYNRLASQQVEDYINYFDFTYGLFSQLPKEFSIKIEIKPDGKIQNIDLISKKKSSPLTEDLLSKMILNKLPSNEHHQLLIPIKKN